ncbi:hypothetical protein ES703_60928 [subsurface metagenome]
MARITPSALVDDIKGSIGGVTFSSWKGMSYVKAKAKSVRNPATADQLEIRNAMTFFSRRYYDDLTDDQRGAWDQYAQEVAGAERSDKVQGGFGSRVVPVRQFNRSGYNWFIAINVVLVKILGFVHYAAPIDDAPLGQTPPSTPELISVTYDNTTGKFVWTAKGPQDLGHAENAHVLLWALPNFAYARVQAGAIVTGNAEAIGPLDLDTLKIQRAILGLPLPDGLYAFQLSAIGHENGLMSPPSAIVKVAGKFVGV